MITKDIFEVGRPLAAGVEGFGQLGELGDFQRVDIGLEELAPMPSMYTLLSGWARCRAVPVMRMLTRSSKVRTLPFVSIRCGPMMHWSLFRMNQAVGVGADDGRGVLVQFQGTIDEEQPGAVAGALLVGDVSDEPEPISPGHQRADTGLAAPRVVLGLDGEGRENAGDRKWGRGHGSGSSMR